MRAATVHQAEAEESHHEHGAEHVEEHQRALVRIRLAAAKHRGQSAVNDDQPEDQTSEQENLPNPAQLEVLPSLVAQPEPCFAEQAFDAECFPEQAPGNDQERCQKQQVHQQTLTFRLPLGDQRREEDACSDPGDRNPEDGQLEVPAFGPTVGVHLAYELHVEAAGVHGVVCQQSAVEDLDHKQQAGHEEVFGTGPLTGCQRCLKQLIGSFDALGRAVEELVPMHDVHHDAQHHEQAQYCCEAPDVRFGGGAIAHRPVRRPVVGVGETLTRSVRPGGPGRPEEEIGNVLLLHLVTHGLLKEPVAWIARLELLRPIAAQLLQGISLSRR